MDITPRPAVSAAIFRDENVLLVQRRSPPFAGCWSLPGGHIKPGERTLDAIRRELFEEAGIIASALALADLVDVIERDGNGALLFHKVIAVFYGAWHEGDARAADDAGAVKWVSREEIGALPTTFGLAEVVKDCWEKFHRDNAH